MTNDELLKAFESANAQPIVVSADVVLPRIWHAVIRLPATRKSEKKSQ
jgi:hypothetical protein